MSKCIKGTDSAEELVATPKGSYIFGSGSADSDIPDQVICDISPDTIYFSMCHIKSNGVDTVITNFSQDDKVILFCSHEDLDDTNVEVEYDAAKDQTLLRINAERVQNAIVAIDGEHTDLQIEFNTPFKTVCGVDNSEHHHHHH